MKVLFLGLVFFSCQGWSQSSPLLELNPYSISEIKNIYPKAIITHAQTDQDSFSLKKRNTKFKYREEIDYAKLVPEMIKLIQDQQNEIDQLKRKIK
jgi:hypothetical protein